MIKEIARFIINLVFYRRLEKPTHDEKKFVSELRDTFNKLEILETSDSQPSEAKWLSNMNRLKDLILKKDPRKFLRWDVVLSTMFISNARFVPIELNYLKSRHDWNKRWSNAIKESPIGHPIPYILYPASSGNLITHAYHIAKFEEISQVKINSMDFVFEFGGGYGSMCRLFYNLGFQGKYVLFDLPAFSALQVYYLKALGLPVKTTSDFIESKNGIISVSDFETLDNILVDHNQSTMKMFIAMWSISETPVRTRKKILSQTSDFHSLLLGFQDRFEEVDNLEYFGKWKESMNKFEWNSWQIEHIPGNNYLVGVRNDQY